jgi:cation diffusion facilitator family transporter
VAGGLVRAGNRVGAATSERRSQARLRHRGVRRVLVEVGVARVTVVVCTGSPLVCGGRQGHRGVTVGGQWTHGMLDRAREGSRPDEMEEACGHRGDEPGPSASNSRQHPASIASRRGRGNWEVSASGTGHNSFFPPGPNLHMLLGVRGERSASFVAMTSVVAAVGLTTFKLVVGLNTGSLGILSEFAHSGLDLVAALITFFAVRAAARPADSDHPYGHGKLESFSALVETLLLLATCVWISYEAVERLAGRPKMVQATTWAFVVMATSIVVDVSRSRALARAAKRFGSQALEADALHFSTDVWSSSVVILGLVAVRIGQHTSRPDLWWRADAIAALGVALVATYVGVKLGKRTYNVLVDRAPAGVRERVLEAVRKVPGVVSCERVRVRTGGVTTFVDLNIEVQAPALEAAHGVAHEVERRVQEVIPAADVMVHTDPHRGSDSSVPLAIRQEAARRDLPVHSVSAHRSLDGVHATFHLEVDPALTLAEARRIADEFEIELRRQMTEVVRVDIQLELREGDVPHKREYTPDENLLRGRVRQVALGVREVRDCHDVHIDVVGQTREVALHCTFDPDLPMSRVHELCHVVAERLRAEIPELGRVSVQAEPRPQGTARNN